MNHAADKNQTATRQRLTQAAADVFSERGYEGATIREICRRAKANVAAVNYHFRDKTELYTEVFRQAHFAATGEIPAVVAANHTPEEQLRAFITTFLHRILSPDSPQCHARLMAHELLSPTPALDILVDEMIRPHFLFLSAIVKELAPHADNEQIRYMGGSIMGQILFFKNSQPIIRRLFPQDEFDLAHIERIAAHVTAFSLAAIRGLPASPHRAAARRPVARRSSRRKEHV